MAIISGGQIIEGVARRRKKATVTLTSAQILALFTTPITVVPAPAAGSYLAFEGMLLKYAAGATAYTLTGATNFEVRFTNASGALVNVVLAVAGVLDQATNQIRLVKSIATNVTPVAAAVLVIGIGGADPTLGNGTVTVEVLYSVIA